MTSLPYSSTSQ